MVKVFSAPSSLRMDGKSSFNRHPKHWDPVEGREFTKAEVDHYMKE